MLSSPRFCPFPRVLLRRAEERSMSRTVLPSRTSSLAAHVVLQAQPVSFVTRAKNIALQLGIQFRDTISDVVQEAEYQLRIDSDAAGTMVERIEEIERIVFA